MKDIIIRGAREHNLKNVDVVLPRDKFIVITGLSGSGKSTLAFDTLYAEGQRRYVESLSAYARPGSLCIANILGVAGTAGKHRQPKTTVPESETVSKTGSKKEST